jgi:hypothetical protein
MGLDDGTLVSNKSVSPLLRFSSPSFHFLFLTIQNLFENTLKKT